MRNIYTKIKQKVDKFIGFLYPHSVFDNGTPRLVSIDFMRGMSAFGLCLAHEVFFFHDINSILKKTRGFSAAIIYVFGAPFILFANWRQIFPLISGITNGYFNHQ